MIVNWGDIVQPSAPVVSWRDVVTREAVDVVDDPPPPAPATVTTWRDTGGGLRRGTLRRYVDRVLAASSHERLDLFERFPVRDIFT